jgi:hypothetical protein
MLKRLPLLLLLTTVLVAFAAMSLYAAKAPVEKQVSPAAYHKSLLYSFPDANDKHLTRAGDGSSVEMKAQQDLGAASSAVPPPFLGYHVGNTWYEYQRNGSMRRMIAANPYVFGSPDTNAFVVQFSWMYLPGDDISTSRAYKYDAFAVDEFGNVVPSLEATLQPGDEYAGYVGITARNDGAAIVGGHNNLVPPNGPYHTQIYFDFSPNSGFFNTNTRIPNATSEYCDYETGSTGAIWPAFEYVEGDDTVLHVIAQESRPAAGDPQALVYFRKVGVGSAGTWQHPPYCIDSVNDLAQDIEATDDGMVALFWIANVQDPSFNCNGGDTCSSVDFVNAVQWDNDVYVQISTNYGVSFQPRMNITKNTFGENGYRPYTDLSGLITSDGVVHCVYGTGDFDAAGPTLFLRGRFFHWDNSTNDVVIAVDYSYDQTDCNGGAWNLNASKMSLSECDGKLYILFTQFNDPEITLTDCSDEGAQGGAQANGELYITVSNDDGGTWDKPRNLTNTHTPGCDSTVSPANDACRSEHWSSMVRIGSNYDGAFPAEAVLDETDYGGTVNEHNGYYLDAQYIGDVSAGGIVQNEGAWQNSDLKWIRIPCLEPVLAANFVASPISIGYPAYVKPGNFKDTLGLMEGLGNDSGNVDVTTQQTAGPGSGWLTVSPTTWRFGPNGAQPLTIKLNASGSNPGTTTYIAGRILFDWGGDSNPPQDIYDTMNVQYWITDTIVAPEWDTITTGTSRAASISLTVSNHGGMGNFLDSVNMDYMNQGDCTDNNDPDTLGDNAEAYLGDGSPFVMYVDDGTDDTTGSWLVFLDQIADTNSFRPLGGNSKSSTGSYEVFNSGRFITADSAFTLEKMTFAPLDSDSGNFMIQCVKIYRSSGIGTTHIPIHVRLGEVIDWDIPADTGSRNNSNFDAARGAVYQQGTEENGSGCQPNNTRWGGMAFLQCLNVSAGDTEVVNDPHGAYTASNEVYIYPEGGLVETQFYGLTATSGYSKSDSIKNDLHSVIVFDTLPTFTSADTFVYYIVLATIQNGNEAAFKAILDAGEAWYCDHIAPLGCGCCANRGNVDNIIGPGGPVDVADLTYLVAFLFQGGAAPPCIDQGNVDSIVGPGGPIDVADLTYLVAFLFQGGSAPPPC